MGQQAGKHNSNTIKQPQPKPPPFLSAIKPPEYKSH